MTRSSNSLTKRTREKLRFGLVGAGAVAQSYLQAFEGCDEAKVVGVADSRVDAADRVAERMRCRGYDRVDRMIENCQLDAAIVCTPPVTHPDICTQLVENKIHVLCEKPFSIDEEGAHRMLDAAHKAGVKLTMASKFRYVEDVIRAKSIVSSGVLGDLILFENVFAHRVDMATRWNSRPETAGGGVLIDNGTHSVDLMRYFLGPLAEVHALEGRRSQGLLVEETVSLFVRSVSGVICNIDLSWSITKQRDSYLDIYGSRGAVSIGWKKSSYLDFSHGKWVAFGRGYNKIKAFRSQIENFARAIREEEPLLITAEDATASVNIIESAYKALRQNQWVPVSYTLNPAAFQRGAH
jgi:predicted dehydrogenase